MDLVEILSVWVLLALVAGTWLDLTGSRSLRARLWSLLARKPHTNRRGYAMRMMVYHLESLRILAPMATAMLVAVLLMCYFVYVRGWPDLAGVAGFLATTAGAIAIGAVKTRQIARRAGLICPACNAQLGNPPRGPGLLQTGRCSVCTTTIFQIASVVWNPKWPPELLRRKYGSVARHDE